jgi:hypothetical protein
MSQNLGFFLTQPACQLSSPTTPLFVALPKPK